MTKALAKARVDSASLATYDHQVVAAAIDSLETAAGGRAQLIAALVRAPQTDDLAYVINLIADPSMDARKLSAICRAGRVPLGELLEAFKRGVYAQMFVDVSAKVALHTPAVVEDVMTRAQPHEVECYACRGSLVVDNPRQYEKDQPPVLPCTACIDVNRVPTGKITILPDLDRQKLALDLAQVLPKKTPLVAVDARQVHTTFGQDASPEGFARLLAATDQVLHRRRGVVPVVDEDPPVEADVAEVLDSDDGEV